MRRAITYSQKDFGLLEKYIGSAYDKLMPIANNLEDLVRAGRALGIMVETLFYKFTAVEGQTVFSGADDRGRVLTLSGPEPFVYIGLARLAADGYEVDETTNTFTLLTPVPEGTEVLIGTFGFNADGTLYTDDLLSQESVLAILQTAQAAQAAAEAASDAALGHAGNAADNAAAAALSASQAEASAIAAAAAASSVDPELLMPKAGGTFTGNVSGPEPTEPDHLVTVSWANNAFLAKTGGTLTGSLLLESTQPEIQLNESDAPVNQRRSRLISSGGLLQLDGLADDGELLETFLQILRNADGTFADALLASANEVLANAKSLVTRERGDARWAPLGGASVPIGTVLDYAGSTTPPGWFICNGQTPSRTTYAELFAVIGTTYGAGDGSTTFNVPDLRGRVVAGKDDMGGGSAGRLTAAGSGIAATTLGASGGTQTHTLTVSEIPSHRHAINSGTTSGAGFSYQTGDVNVSGTRYTEYEGGSAAHRNVQPTFILNKIIKAQN